jgi:hypothetical protein
MMLASSFFASELVAICTVFEKIFIHGNEYFPSRFQ